MRMQSDAAAASDEPGSILKDSIGTSAILIYRRRTSTASRSAPLSRFLMCFVLRACWQMQSLS